MGVEATYLDAAFAAIEARHGSLDGYLEQALGVDSGPPRPDRGAADRMTGSRGSVQVRPAPCPGSRP
jgi:hypothetical protein